MISCDLGKVKIKGNVKVLMAELQTLVNAMYIDLAEKTNYVFAKKIMKDALLDSFKTEQELDAFLKENLKNITVEDFLKAMFGDDFDKEEQDSE